MVTLKTPWYDKAVEALKLNGKSESSQKAYARQVRKLIEFYNGKDPDQITEEELKNYFIHRPQSKTDFSRFRPRSKSWPQLRNANVYRKCSRGISGSKNQSQHS